MAHITYAELEVGQTYSMTWNNGQTQSKYIHQIIRSNSGRYKIVCDYLHVDSDGNILHEIKGYQNRVFNVGTKHIWHW